jgi:hypothetical protein
VAVPAERGDQSTPVGGITALVVGARGFIESLPDAAGLTLQVTRRRGPEIDAARIIRIGKPMPQAEGRRKSREQLRVGTRHVVELHRLPGPEIRAPDPVMDVAAVRPLVEHRAAHEVVPVEAGKEQVLEVVPGLRHDERADHREGLLEAQDERIVWHAGRHQIGADPVETGGVSQKHLRGCGAFPAGRVL